MPLYVNDILILIFYTSTWTVWLPLKKLGSLLGALQFSRYTMPRADIGVKELFLSNTKIKIDT